MPNHSLADPCCGVQAQCLANPYGSGYGPCLGLSRAREATLFASTSLLDFDNATELDTHGASALATFEIEGQTFLAVANYFDATKLDYANAPPRDVNASDRCVLLRVVELRWSCETLCDRVQVMIREDEATTRLPSHALSNSKSLFPQPPHTQCQQTSADPPRSRA